MSYKLQNPEPIDPENDLEDRIKKLGNNFADFAIWSNSSNNVLELFPDPPASNCVHIIVEILPESKPARCHITNQNPIQCFVHFLQLRAFSFVSC